jgi:hypothetical protein
MNLSNLLNGWRTTLLAVFTVLAVVVPPTKAWLEATTNIDATAIFGLVMAIYLALRSDPK